METNPMKIYTLWITRTYSPEDAPEMIEAWDEYSADDNYEGYRESFEKAKASIGSDLAQWREITLTVPLNDIEGQFAGRDVPANVST
jgi:hypothetical protein